MVPDGLVPRFSTVMVSVADTFTMPSITNNSAGRLKPKMGWLDENILYFDSSTLFVYETAASTTRTSTPVGFAGLAMALEASKCIGAELASDPAMNNRARTIAARRMPLTHADAGQSI